MLVNSLRHESQVNCSQPYQTHMSHPPSSVPEYMWERSAEVEPFSLITLKFSENTAALRFKCSRKVLKETKTQTVHRCCQNCGRYAVQSAAGKYGQLMVDICYWFRNRNKEHFLTEEHCIFNPTVYL